jgi:hypothetical protein
LCPPAPFLEAIKTNVEAYNFIDISLKDDKKFTDDAISLNPHLIEYMKNIPFLNPKKPISSLHHGLLR